jgi:tyrosinase
MALLAVPLGARAQNPLRTRVEWQQFKKTPQLASFINAVKAMKAKTNPLDPSSWQYWVKIHENSCPHGGIDQPNPRDGHYFITWHRGYLYYFEQQLRAVSGDSALNLPYWDYYSFPAIPDEFADPTNGNPLYMARNTKNVYSALDLAPFGVYNFQIGRLSAFETLMQSKPHDPVHDLIGGVMATLKSPLDPIFFLHHCNVDRLTHAWALPDGKGIPYASLNAPASSDPYWAGSHTYTFDAAHTNTSLTMERYRTCDPTWLGYSYASVRVPTALPPQPRLVAGSAAQLMVNSDDSRNALAVAPALSPPPEGNFPATPGRIISDKRRSLAGVANVRLRENSLGARISLAQDAAQALKDSLAAASGTNGPLPPGVPRSVDIVLDQITITDLGKGGGYFYNLYLNFPLAIDAANLRKRHFLGTLGAFQIGCMMHHGSVKLSFPATELLLNQALVNLSKMTVSCVRVDGDNQLRGDVIAIGEARVEISTDDPWDNTPPGPTPPGPWYN